MIRAARRWPALAGAACAGILWAACTTTDDPTEAGDPGAQVKTGVLTGRVTRGPLTPVSGGPSARKSEPLVGATVVVEGPDAPRAQAVATDRRGEYHLRLRPGTYRITMPSLPPVHVAKALPATVTINAGQETRLDITVDTGIR